MFAEGRPYTVISQSPPFALSISNEPDNELVVGRLSEGGNDEKWIVTGEGPDTYIIKNVANGKFLGVEGEPREGVRVIAADSPTFWRIEAEGSGFYGIFLKDSELNVGLNFILPTLTPPAIIQDGRRQPWKFEAAK